MNWQPIETAPKVDGEEFLVWDGYSIRMVWLSWIEDGQRIFCGDGCGSSATHWMPLPEPPQ